MSLTIYLISAVLVFVFSGLLAMAGLGVAFLFVPLFYYLGVLLAESTSTALLLNVVSLLFATINYWRGKLINWRVGLPVLITAVFLSPFGARPTQLVDTTLLLGMFVAFLLFAGFMMLFYKAKEREHPLNWVVEFGAGAGVGTVAGFLGGLLGVGGGNFNLPLLNWLGMDPKMAAGTTALVVVFSSFSGFLGHATKVSGQQLKRIIGVLLWLIAIKMIFDLIKSRRIYNGSSFRIIYSGLADAWA